MPTFPSVETKGNTASKEHRLWHLGSAFHWALLDAVVALVCMLAAFHLSPASGQIYMVESHARPLLAASLFAGLTFFSSYALGLGHYLNLRSRFQILILVLALTAIAIGATLIVSSLVFYKQIGRYIVIISASSYFLLIACSRLGWYERIIQSKHQIAIWSSRGFADQLRNLVDKSAFPIEVVCALEAESGNSEVLTDAINTHQIHEIVVQASEIQNNPQLLAALDQGVAVSTASTFAERHFFKIPIAFITPEWFFQVDFKQHHPFYNSTKRLLDLLLALGGGLIALPLVVFAGILIKIESRGPMFYSQIRIGLRQRPFTIRKLRTMQIDSEQTGPQWAKLHDPRVTRIGRILRKTRIDELPQFWNILIGEMTFVGPRPERPEFVNHLNKVIQFYQQRHLVKPGLTGWAQICYPYGASEDDAREKLSYDLYYIKNFSFFLDVQILVQTIGAITKGSR